MDYGSEELLKIRIAAAIALAAGVALGASGCSLVAAQGTNVAYAPSDGVEISAHGVDLRNIILVADENGENFNLVFTAVNTTGQPAAVSISMAADSSTATQDISIPTGTTSFGNPEEGQDVIMVTLPGLLAGQTVKSYFTVNGEGDMLEYVPALDGTLLEYQPYVLSPAPEVEAEDEAKDETAADAKKADNNDAASTDLVDAADAEGTKAASE